MRKLQVTYNLKLNGLSIQLNGSDLEVYTNCANVTFCVCVILQREKYSHLEDTSSSFPFMHIHVPECVAEKNTSSLHVIYICVYMDVFGVSDLP